MSLFRLGILVAAGVALMPADEAKQQELYTKVAHAAHWTATFCDRNAVTCDNASQAWDVFVKKAEFAGRVAMDLAARYSDDGGGQAASQASLSTASTGTLRPEDLKPAWRGPESSRGI